MAYSERGLGYLSSAERLELMAADPGVFAAFTDLDSAKWKLDNARLRAKEYTLRTRDAYGRAVIRVEGIFKKLRPILSLPDPPKHADCVLGCCAKRTRVRVVSAK